MSETSEQNRVRRDCRMARRADHLLCGSHRRDKRPESALLRAPVTARGADKTCRPDPLREAEESAVVAESGIKTHATIYKERRAMNVIGKIAGKPDHRIRHIFSRTDAAIGDQF